MVGEKSGVAKVLKESCCTIVLFSVFSGVMMKNLTIEKPYCIISELSWQAECLEFAMQKHLAYTSLARLVRNCNLFMFTILKCDTLKIFDSTLVISYSFSPCFSLSAVCIQIICPFGCKLCARMDASAVCATPLVVATKPNHG